jgi:hypothetical protein
VKVLSCEDMVGSEVAVGYFYTDGRRDKRSPNVLT